MDKTNKNTINSSSLFPEPIRIFLKNLISDIDEPMYLVGGAVRDLISGKSISDYDILTKSSPEKFLFKARKQCGGTYFCLDEELQIFRLMPSKKFNSSLKHKVHFDFAMFYGKTLEDDLLKRDFTINAIAADLKTLLKKPEHLKSTDPALYIDSTEGINDILNRTIRIVSKDSFKDDPLRLLRLFRFKAQLDFDIEKNTLFQAKKDSYLICQAAAERRTEEIFKIFETHNSESIFDAMNNSFLLSRIFDETPETEKLKIINESIENFDQKIEKLMLSFKKNYPDFLRYIKENPLSQARELSSLIKFLKLAQKYNFSFTPENRKNFMLNNKELEVLKKTFKFYSVYNEKKYDSEMIKCLNSWSGNYLHITFSSAFLISEMNALDFKQTFDKIHEKYRFFKKAKNLLKGRDLKQFGISSGPLMGELLNRIWLICVNKELDNKKIIEGIIPDLISELEKSNKFSSNMTKEF